ADAINWRAESDQIFSLPHRLFCTASVPANQNTQSGTDADNIQIATSDGKTPLRRSAASASSSERSALYNTGHNTPAIKPRIITLYVKNRGTGGCDKYGAIQPGNNASTIKGIRPA